MSREGYLGLGSNVGDRRANLQAAADALPAHGVEVLAASSVYDTEPVGEVLDQPDFLNACLRIRTALAPEALLDACKAVERELGRAAGGVRHGPRPIDVDLLLLGAETFRSERLSLPHEQVTSRRFVLVPLLELAPGPRRAGRRAGRRGARRAGSRKGTCAARGRRSRWTAAGPRGIAFGRVRRPDLHGPAPPAGPRRRRRVRAAPGARGAGCGETYCVGFERAGCVTAPHCGGRRSPPPRPTPTRDRIELGEVARRRRRSPTAARARRGGRRRGRSTVLRGGLTPVDPASRLLDATVHELALSGAARQVDVPAPPRCAARAVLERRARARPRRRRRWTARRAWRRPWSSARRDRRCASAAARAPPRGWTRATSRSSGRPARSSRRTCAAAAARIADSILWAPAGAGLRRPGMP